MEKSEMTADTNVRSQGGRPEAPQHDRGNESKQESERRGKGQGNGDADQAQNATRDAAESVRETMQTGAEAARRGMENVASDVAEQTRRTAGSIKQAMEVHQGTIQSAAEDFKAAATAATESAEGIIKIDTALVDWMGQNVQAIARVSQRLLGSRSPQEAAQAQREFSETMMKTWMESNALILRATQEIANRALGPVTQRVEQRVQG